MWHIYKVWLQIVYIFTIEKLKKKNKNKNQSTSRNKIRIPEENCRHCSPHLCRIKLPLLLLADLCDTVQSPGFCWEWDSTNSADNPSCYVGPTYSPLLHCIPCKDRREFRILLWGLFCQYLPSGSTYFLMCFWSYLNSNPE